MEIQTSRFGRMTVDDSRVMTFPRGLLGFPNHSRFALIQTGEENYFFWLQSVDDPNLAFVVTDPTIFFKDYEAPLRSETMADLNMADPGFAQVFVVCNKVGDWLTGNLLGPIVINAANHLAQQVVLTEKKWTTRQPLLRLQAEVPLWPVGPRLAVAERRRPRGQGQHWQPVPPLVGPPVHWPVAAKCAIANGAGCLSETGASQRAP